MPQTVRVEGGEPTTFDAMQLGEREFAVLVQLDEGHVGPEPGDVVYLDNGSSRGVRFFSTTQSRSWFGGGSGHHLVRRLRPGERIVIEEQ